MQKYRKLNTRILSLVLSVAMVATMTSMTAIAVEDDNTPPRHKLGGDNYTL